MITISVIQIENIKLFFIEIGWFWIRIGIYKKDDGRE